MTKSTCADEALGGGAGMLADVGEYNVDLRVPLLLELPNVKKLL